jgi:antitoxin (DNA-binding transcriptional repressor) of toxin-antitoxin stability system
LVTEGKKVLITRCGKPIAMLIPPPRSRKQELRRMIDEMFRVRDRSGPRLGKLRIRDLVREGRR